LVLDCRALLLLVSYQGGEHQRKSAEIRCRSSESTNLRTQHHRTILHCQSQPLFLTAISSPITDENNVVLEKKLAPSVQWAIEMLRENQTSNTPLGFLGTNTLPGPGSFLSQKPGAQPRERSPPATSSITDGNEYCSVADGHCSFFMFDKSDHQSTM
jgi:hypothetical protein